MRIYHEPRIVIKGYYGEPSHPSLCLNLMADKEWKSAQSRQATYNLRRYELEEPDPNQSEADKGHRAISLSYCLSSQDQKTSDWTQIISDKEKILRQATLAGYQAEKTDLLDTISERDDTTPTEEEKERLTDINTIIGQLQAGGSGYLESAPNAFGDGRNTLYRSLCAPNIPFQYISNFRLEADRPFSIWLYRFKPNADQEDARFRLEWGHWRLELLQDREAKLYRFNGSLNKTQIDALETGLEALLDEGRETFDDKLFYKEQRDAIEAIKRAAKEDGRSPDEYTADENLRIKQAQDAIDERRKAKRGLTGEQEAQAEELRKKIYLNVQSVNLGESSESLFNVPLRLTFLPQKRGFLAIQLEGADKPFVYEDKAVTATKGYANIWSRTKLNITGNGGAFLFKWGYPEIAQEGVFALQRFRPGFVVDASLLEVGGQWDDTTPGTSVEYVLERVSGSDDAPTYQLRVVLRSDGRYAPWLYSARVFAPPGERNGSDAVVFDSDHYPDSQGYPPIREVVPSYEEEAGRISYEVTLRDYQGHLELPDLHDRLADIYIDGVRVLKNGIIRTAARENMKTAGQNPQSRNETLVRLTVSDPFAVLDDHLITEDIDGDGQPLGRFLRTLLRLCGTRSDELVGIPENAGRTLPKAGVGEDPAIKPSKDAKLGEYVRSLIDLYGMGLELSYVAGAFTLGTPSSVTKAAFTGDVENGSRFLVQNPLLLPHDFGDYYNIFNVEGAADVKTKKRISRSWTIWESIRQPGHPSYIGRPKRYPTQTDDALRTADDVIWALRSLMLKYAKPGRFVQYDTFFHPGLRPRDRLTVDGKPCEIVRILSASVAGDTMQMIVREVA